MLRSTDCRGAFAETVELQRGGEALPSPVADETADLGLETDVDRTGSEAVRPDEIGLAVSGLLEVRQGAVERPVSDPSGPKLKSVSIISSPGPFHTGPRQGPTLSAKHASSARAGAAASSISTIAVMQSHPRIAPPTT
jgi:hypothetical protein